MSFGGENSRFLKVLLTEIKLQHFIQPQDGKNVCSVNYNMILTKYDGLGSGNVLESFLRKIRKRENIV